MPTDNAVGGHSPPYAPIKSKVCSWTVPYGRRPESDFGDPKSLSRQLDAHDRFQLRQGLLELTH